MERKHSIRWHDASNPIPSSWFSSDSNIQIMDPVDDELLDQVRQAIHTAAPKATIQIIESPLFLFNRNQL